jgi:predicted nucleic acid-binding protein/antitoxin (DNA-binding transcriptional repressor) of toxin-antitoxin stability system
VYTIERCIMKVGARELRSKTAFILEEVQRGRDVTILYRRQPVAVIKPIGIRKRRRTFEAIGFGLWAAYPTAQVRQMTFDTDILIWYLRGNERARIFLSGIPFGRRALSVMVYFELLQGCRGKSEQRSVHKFIQQNFSCVIHLSEQISHRALSLLERHAISHGIEAADSLIAATALVNRHSLATGNPAHYRPIRGLELVVFHP